MSIHAKERTTAEFPHTPDGRYFVVRGRLWRLTNPSLSDQDRRYWVKELMDARREIRNFADQPDQLRVARVRVSKAKNELGERGPPWWRDGAPDYNRRRVENTPYADWHAAQAVKADPKPLNSRP